MTIVTNFVKYNYILYSYYYTLDKSLYIIINYYTLQKNLLKSHVNTILAAVRLLIVSRFVDWFLNSAESSNAFYEKLRQN